MFRALLESRRVLGCSQNRGLSTGAFQDKAEACLRVSQNFPTLRAPNSQDVICRFKAQCNKVGLICRLEPQGYTILILNPKP